MKYLKKLCLSVIAFSATSVFAATRPLTSAQEIANQVLGNSNEVTLSHVKTVNSDSLYYVFTGKAGGYAVISANLQGDPVLGYSKGAAVNDMSESLRLLLDDCEKNARVGQPAASSANGLKAAAAQYSLSGSISVDTFYTDELSYTLFLKNSGTRAYNDNVIVKMYCKEEKIDRTAIPNFDDYFIFERDDVTKQYYLGFNENVSIAAGDTFRVDDDIPSLSYTSYRVYDVDGNVIASGPVAANYILSGYVSIDTVAAGDLAYSMCLRNTGNGSYYHDVVVRFFCKEDKVDRSTFPQFDEYFIFRKGNGTTDNYIEFNESVRLNAGDSVFIDADIPDLTYTGSGFYDVYGNPIPSVPSYAQYDLSGYLSFDTLSSGGLSYALFLKNGGDAIYNDQVAVKLYCENTVVDRKAYPDFDEYFFIAQDDVTGENYLGFNEDVNLASGDSMLVKFNIPDLTYTKYRVYDASGNVIVSAPASVTNFKAENFLTISVEPSALVVEASAPASIVVADVFGHVLVSRSLAQAEVLRVNLPAGVYIVNGTKVLIR